MIEILSITHQGHCLEEREILSKEINLDQYANYVHLSTCNREEIYYGDGFINKDIVNHLFRVASGLESALIGETAIQAQVRRAFKDAVKEKTISKSLSRLFQSAIRTSKRVRFETGISKGAVSHSLAVLNILEKRKIDIKKSVVCIIGVSNLNIEVIKYLLKRSVKSVIISNRNFDKAKKIANKYGCDAFHFDKLESNLKDTDILICATSAPHPVVHKDKFPKDKEMIIFDLAVPRDVEPDISKNKFVELFNIEDVERIINHDKNKRRALIQDAEEIIKEELDKFMEKQSRMNKLLS